MTHWKLGCLVLLTMTAVALARPGTVETTDGRVFQGEVTETNEGVSVNVGGIRTVIPREQVRQVTYGTFEERFRKRLDELPADDLEGRLGLAREALAADEYDLAREAALAGLAIAPDSPQVQQLLEAIDRQQRLAALAQPEAAARQQQAQPEDQRADPREPQQPAERRFLTMDDVYEIRRKELKPGDNVRVRFEGQVKQSFAAAQGVEFSTFNRQDPVTQALQIIQNGTPEMAKQVQIMTDPEALADFRRQVQPLIQNCATSGCHNGGGFVLFDRAGQTEAVYTNFYILTQYAKAAEGGPGGLFGGPTARPMILRGQGENALLAQYALPPAEAETPHPEVQGYRGVVRGPGDANFRQLVNWQNQSLKPIQPDYDITYQLPGNPPAPAQGGGE